MKLKVYYGKKYLIDVLMIMMNTIILLFLVTLYISNEFTGLSLYFTIFLTILLISIIAILVSQLGKEDYDIIKCRKFEVIDE